MARYYRLGHHKERRNSGGSWPYVVAVCFDGVPRPVRFAEGSGGLAGWGSELTAAEAMEPRWIPHFENARAAWLRPYIERMAAGEPVSAHEAVAQFAALHGSPPAIEE
jgi:hypothetical protein